MTPEQHERVQSIFLAASRRPADDRVRFLDEACGSDAEIRREVEELLAFHTTAGDDSLTGLRDAVAAVALDTPAPLDAGTVLDGKLRIEGIIGEGGMGTVFRAVQLALERPVAVKIIRPSVLRVRGVVERLRREALAVARLHHPNVVSIYDFCSSEEAGAYLVMELVEGEPLGDALARAGRFSPSYAVAVVQQIAAGVQAAHEVNVIHRDLKPQNILLDSTASAPRVKVLDFGIAKLLGDPGGGTPVSTEGGFLGTPLYVSPEQASGLACDARSDVYSLGCILHELLTGRPPFSGSSVAKILVDHVGSPPKAPSRREAGIPAWLDAVVLKALEKDPASRYQSAADLADALAAGVLEVSEARAAARAARTAPSGPRRARPDRPPNNLPAPLTAFVGRERDVRNVNAGLADAPLVTLTGPGGVGKTRLAVRAAAALLDREGVDAERPEECWYVDLAPVADAPGVARAAAAVVGARADEDAALPAAVAERLAPRRVLLVLDNCEHVAEACAALVAALVAACPRLRVLATSRASLRVAGETVYPVAPLRLPADAATPEEAAESEAVRLFVERAQLVSTVFRATDDALDAIVQICREVDGLPLAIELAAARARVLTVHQIRDRLRDRLRLLRSASSPGRHESLRAAIDWSYQMLGSSEATLFERLAVFTGGFTIDAIEAVCSDSRVDALDALDILAGLADKSLVGVAHAQREARYFLLETVREYAAERLEARGDAARFRARHRDYFLSLAEEAARKFQGPEAAEWGARLQTEIDNLRAALAWSRDEPGDGVTFLLLAKALHAFFYQRGYLAEGRAWLEAALERVGEGGPPDAKSVALAAAGNFALDQGDLEAAREIHERALAIDRARGDDAGVASALHNLGNILTLVGDYAGARERFEESYALCRASGRPHNVALSLFTQACVAVETADWARGDELLSECEAIYASIDYAYGLSLARTERAYVAMVRGQLDRIDALLDEALEASRAAEQRHNVALVSVYRANVARYAGDVTRVDELAAGALAEFRALGDKDCSSMALYVMARAARQRGELDLAAERLVESLALRARLGMRKGLAECFEEAAAIASARGDAAAAARLLGTAAATRLAAGAPVQPIDAADREATREAVLAALGSAAFERAMALGAALSIADAVALARRVL